jgi:Mg2+/Co2+ transporter CorB
MEEGGVRRLLVLDEEGWVIGIVSVDDLLREIAGDLAALAGSLRKGIAREASERHVARGASRPRALYPDFGMAAMQ